jgi:phage-related protein
MTETFPTSIVPTIGTNKKHTPKVKEIAFGNGYKQLYGDGLNSDLEKWSLTFILDDTDKQTVEDFFIAAAGYLFFNWTAPDAGAAQKQYLCQSWDINFLGGTAYRITTTFDEWAGLT